MESIDLAFHRCPSAMTRARKFIEHLHASGESIGEVTTIEPALMKHIESVLNSDYPELCATISNSTPINEAMIKQWELSPLFDEDDLDRAENLITIVVQTK